MAMLLLRLLLYIHNHTHTSKRTYEERTPAVDLLGSFGRLSVRVAVSKEGASTRLIVRDAVVMEIEKMMTYEGK